MRLRIVIQGFIHSFTAKGDNYRLGNNSYVKNRKHCHNHYSDCKHCYCYGHLCLTVLEHLYLCRVGGTPRFCLSGCCCSTVLVNVNGKKSSLKIIMEVVKQKCLALFLYSKCNDFLVSIREHKPVVYIYSLIAILASLCPNSATLPLCRKANKILEV